MTNDNFKKMIAESGMSDELAKIASEPRFSFYPQFAFDDDRECAMFCDLLDEFHIPFDLGDDDVVRLESKFDIGLIADKFVLHTPNKLISK